MTVNSPAPTSKSKGSFGSAQNYHRMVDTFPSTTATNGHTFSAKMAMNKLGALVLVVAAAAAGSLFIHVANVAVIVAMFAAFAVALVIAFKPRMAKSLAFIYAILEGVVLGWFSNLMSGGNKNIVEMAIVGTSVVFVGVLVLYRTGLVKVTQHLMNVVLVATIGAAVAGFIAMLASWVIPGNSLVYVLVFGYLYLLIGTANLLVDFDYLYKAQAAQLDAEGEWFGAFMMLLSLVIVYTSLLRILGGRR